MTSVTASIRIIRLITFLPSSFFFRTFLLSFAFCLLSSAAHVDQESAVDAMAVSRFLSEEHRRVVFRADREEAIVAAQAEASRLPLHAAADVARQERLG